MNLKPYDVQLISKKFQVSALREKLLAFVDVKCAYAEEYLRTPTYRVNVRIKICIPTSRGTLKSLKFCWKRSFTQI